VTLIKGAPAYEAASERNPSLCSNLRFDPLGIFAFDGVAMSLK
jgi:hypothetical protein